MFMVPDGDSPFHSPPRMAPLETCTLTNSWTLAWDADNSNACRAQKCESSRRNRREAFALVGSGDLCSEVASGDQIPLPWKCRRS